MILAIDPGCYESAFVLIDGAEVCAAKKVTNDEILAELDDLKLVDVVIEKVESYGMPVGAEVFDTVFWYGRFTERAIRAGAKTLSLVPRRKVKLHHCGSARAKDANVRRAVLDRFGGDAAKRRGGPLHGVKGDAWQALALALYVQDTQGRAT